MHSIIYNCLKMETSQISTKNRMNYGVLIYCTAMKINQLQSYAKIGLNLIKLEKPESVCINFINRKNVKNVFFDGKNVRQKN